MTTQVDWGDGSGEKITLTYGASQGSQTIMVSSPANSGVSPRYVDVTFTTISGLPVVAKTLRITQEAGSGDLVIITRNDVFITDNDVAVGYSNL